MLGSNATMATIMALSRAQNDVSHDVSKSKTKFVQAPHE